MEFFYKKPDASIENVKVLCARNLIMTGKPLEPYLLSYLRKHNNGHVNSVGYSKNDKDWVIRG